MSLLTVTELNEQIKTLLESHFVEVHIKGEVSRPTYHTSGHLYFSLKDKESVIKCVMFRSFVQKHSFKLKDGMEVVAVGKVGVYKPRGEYQLYIYQIYPYGIGDLKIAFEQLKEKLRQKGFFDDRHKKQIPKIVNSIGIVTSIN